MNDQQQKYHREFNRTYFAPGTANRERRRELDRATHARNRQGILDMYGRRCSKCGFDSDVRALQLDHKGSKPWETHRYARSGGTLYVVILNGTLPKELFQILCANCNTIKRLSTLEERSTPKNTIL